MSEYNSTNLSVFRLLRLLRLARIARLARLLRGFPELLVLSKALVMSLRALGATLSLLLLVVYVFTLMFTQLLSETETGAGYFETIPQTFNTLLMMGVFTEQTAFISRMLKGGVVFYLLIIFYLLVCSYTVLNMLIGVICQVISDVANREREDIMIQDMQDRIKNVTRLFEWGDDLDEAPIEDIMVSHQVFADLLGHPDATQALDEVGVDVRALVDVADFVFPEEQHEMKYSKLLETILRFRGSNPATVKDVVDMRQFMNRQINGLERKVSLASRRA